MSGKRNGKKSLVKKKSLFDHINQITAVQNPNYWDDISDEDKKSWSNYMVNRFLSMNSDWTDLVNEIQKYPIEPKDLYKVYKELYNHDEKTFDLMKGGCLNFKYDSNYNIKTDPLFTRKVKFNGNKIVMRNNEMLKA